MSAENSEQGATPPVDVPDVESESVKSPDGISSVDMAVAAASSLAPTPQQAAPRSASAAPAPAVRRQPPTLSSRGSGLNMTSDLAARMRAFHLGRQGAPPSARVNSDTAVLGANPSSPTFASPTGAVPGRIPPKKPSLAEKRGMGLPGGLPGGLSGAGPAVGTPGGKKPKPSFKLSQMGGGDGVAPTSEAKPTGGTMMDKYSEFLDAKTGNLTFKGKATLTSQGVEFEGGKSFSISLDEVDTIDELGKGNYGTVYKVRHSRPRVRRPGMGLAGNKPSHRASSEAESEDVSPSSTVSSLRQGGTSGAVMAMKEIRLELDDAKFSAIIMELDILHRCVSPYIVDFYGAFFQEGAVYICMEFMDGGSIDKIYGDGIPENVLRKIAYATTMGLKCLKEDHNIIHRDVKPTNILINTRGQIKICDFGVSGNLVASIAKTNIGCQSYMAPERISSGGISMPGSAGGTYSVQSDIWSLGLTIIECALGRYPYPPETYNNIFSQLSAIVEGDPPDLPASGYSDAARNFVSGCLNKIPNLRPTYPMLLQHAWLAPLTKPDVIAEEDEEEAEAAAAADAEKHAEVPDDETDEEITPPTDTDSLTSSGVTASALIPAAGVVDAEVATWVAQAIIRRREGKMGKSEKPALHAAPLDAVATPGSPAAEGAGAAELPKEVAAQS